MLLASGLLDKAYTLGFEKGELPTQAGWSCSFSTSNPQDFEHALFDAKSMYYQKYSAWPHPEKFKIWAEYSRDPYFFVIYVPPLRMIKSIFIPAPA